MILRRPIENLASAVRVKRRGIESRDFPDAAFLRANSAPELLAPGPDASNRSDPGDHCASLFPVSHRPNSTLRFEVGFHMTQGFASDVMDEKIADNAIRYWRERGHPEL